MVDVRQGTLINFANVSDNIAFDPLVVHLEFGLESDLRQLVP